MHLIPTEESETPAVTEAGEEAEEANANVFKDLDSVISEGGANLSSGQR